MTKLTLWALRITVYLLVATALMPHIGYWRTLLTVMCLAAILGYTQARMRV